ncbi:MAG: tRNA 2-thiouridine(34) synthase MnmA, partial [Clostridia bacterium]
GFCTAEQDFNDVKRVAEYLDIPYYSVNFAKQYADKVFSYFLEEYRLGRTPNPDVLCNREIKFGPFLDYARAIGADYIATGHYCDISHINGKHCLLKAKDKNKDQTYFLHQLSQNQLQDVLFPLGKLTKPEVRNIATEYNLPTAEKKDSTGICFIGERKFKDFLQQYLPNQEGEIVTVDGHIVGKHSGLMYYTLGQRKGMRLGGSEDGQGRWFVVDKDIANNRLIVSHGDEAPLMSVSLMADKLNWIPDSPTTDKFTCYAKFRYRQSEQKVDVTLKGGEAVVRFYEKQRAITPGQYCVFYDEEKCLGGGVIETVEK